VPLEKEIYQRKVDYLMDVFESQRHKRWFEPETFLSLMRLRGMECNAPSGYATLKVSTAGNSSCKVPSLNDRTDPYVHSYRMFSPGGPTTIQV
jgi:hypothetical protein